MNHQMPSIVEAYKDRVGKINDFIMRSMEVIEDENLRKAMAHYPAAGGKRLRPLLSTIACEAVGGKAEGAIPFGAALELVHNFTLVHDDVMDRDETRRGIKTVHAAYGVPEAILAGDALFARAFELCLKSETDKERLTRLVDILAKSVRILAEGQQLDMDFEKRKSVTASEYIKMIDRKTAVLYSAAAQGGAVVGGATHEQEEALKDYGRLIGLGFQIWDDVLDLISTQEAFGKPVLNDLRNGKKTLIVINALEDLHAEEREGLFRVLGNKDATTEQLVQARDILDREGFIEHATTVANDYVREAKERLSVLDDSKHKDCLSAFADYMVTRKT